VNDLDEVLADLPEHDVDPETAARIARRARAALVRPEPSRLEQWYGRLVEPALVLGVGGVYFVWAIRTATGLAF